MSEFIKRALEAALCSREIHSPRRWQIRKFNGGNSCWLCGWCRLIIRYDSEEKVRG